jgi:hypothetical protein
MLNFYKPFNNLNQEKKVKLLTQKKSKTYKLEKYVIICFNLVVTAKKGRGVVMRKKIALLLSAVLMLSLPLSSVAAAEEVSKKNNPVQHVEAYKIDTYEIGKTDEQFNRVNGYKLVNSVSTIDKTETNIRTLVESVEDYFDTNDKYVKTVVTQQEFTNDYLTGKAKVKETKEEVNKPKAVNPNSTKSKETNESASNKKEIEVNVKNSVNNMGAKPKEQEMKGYTLTEIAELKKKLQDVQVNINPDAPSGQKITPLAVCGTSECAGAYDNYYNYSYTNGTFRLQALSAVGHRYHGITGSTQNSSKNTNSYFEFKGYIDKYEDYIIDEMQYDDFGLGYDWWKVVVGLGSIVAGYAAGPGGWLSITLYYAGALATFSDLTETSYATSQRLTLSKNAAAECENARKMIFQYGGKFENVSYFNDVYGY